MTDPTRSSAEHSAILKQTSSELFLDLKQRVERILDSCSLSATYVAINLPDDEFGLPAWMQLGLTVDQSRRRVTKINDVALSADWGRTENSADLMSIRVSQSMLAAESDQSRSLGCLGMLAVCVTAFEDAIKKT